MQTDRKSAQLSSPSQLSLGPQRGSLRRVIRRFTRAAATIAAAGVCVAAFAMSVRPANAWDAVGHRAITWLALDNLPADAPAFLKDPGNRHGIAWQAAEPDRWRGLKNPYITNATYGDHFIDVEDLEGFGLTIDTVNPLRYRFVRDLAIGRHTHPTGPDDKTPPYNEKLDPTGQKEWVGFVPHAIVENHAKLISMFKTYRILEKINDPNRAPQLEMAKANIKVQMGILSHYVGDTAQPLHTTKHFNGWVGDNPNSYTVAKTFHAYIDGGVLALHKLDYHTLKPGQKYEAKVTAADGTSATDPWVTTLNYIKRSNARVEPLYALEKGGKLQTQEGKAFIETCLHDGAAMLSAYYNSAWEQSAPTPTDISDFIKYDNFLPAQVPEAGAKPETGASAPAPAPGPAPAAAPASAPSPTPATK